MEGDDQWHSILQRLQLSCHLGKPSREDRNDHCGEGKSNSQASPTPINIELSTAKGRKRL
jgi:hypothetical protein